MAVNSATAPALNKKSILTQTTLNREVDWGKWLAAKKVQLDSMDNLNVYGDPNYAPKGKPIL
eukprot:922734-Ditylum_brightwellii.AAC.1